MYLQIMRNVVPQLLVSPDNEEEEHTLTIVNIKVYLVVGHEHIALIQQIVEDRA